MAMWPELTAGFGGPNPAVLNSGVGEGDDNLLQAAPHQTSEDSGASMPGLES